MLILQGKQDESTQENIHAMYSFEIVEIWLFDIPPFHKIYPKRKKENDQKFNFPPIRDISGVSPMQEL